jgi:tetratricopeptide (TPR) repeat protein/transglutaminase-like putative cysteine protease
MSSRVVVLLGSLLVSLQLPAQSTGTSAQSDLSQEAFVFEHLNESVRFENDGSGVRETMAVIRIQSQAGVQAFGQLVFGYSTANEELTVDYVRVRKSNGQVVETPAATAQDFAPEILRQAPMYSDYRERHISVVELQPGVTLEYHTVTRIKPLASREFWYEYSFPTIWALTDGSLQIDVPKSRDIKLKSADHKYESREDGDRRIYTWIVKNFVPKRGKRAEDEEQDDTPDVQLSSFADWQEVSHWYAKLQSERAVPDETIKKKAAELTRGATSEEEKARLLYSYVALNIRYVSLSFGIGRYQPHAASEVLQNGYGDCKDKHTLLQSLLAAEGIQSYPVLIHSELKLDPDVPSPAQFDHVITAAEIGTNLTWLDATEEVAPYGLIAYQLRNKEAVIASNDSFGGLRRTPAEVSVHNLMELNIRAKVSELGTLDADVQMTATGDSDWPLRATFRSVAQANWARVLERLSEIWGMRGDVTDIHIDPLEKTTQPLKIAYRIHKIGYFKVPTTGQNFPFLPPISAGRVPKASTKHPSEPIDIGPAGETVYHVHVEFPANFSVHIPADVAVTRDYGQYTSTYKLSRNVMDAERRMVLKFNELPPMRRADYASFHNVTTGAAEEWPWFNATQPSAAAVASAAEMKGTPEELREAGIAAFKRQDFTTAATLLQRAADQDPSTKEGWEELGQAYADLDQHEKAAHIFQTEIEKDPNQAHANEELAGELVQLGRYDDAIAAYRKEIEIAPSEKSPHKQLGLLLVQLKRDQEAKSELEAAAAIPPDDPQVKMALDQLNARTGDSKNAGLMNASLTGAPAAATINDFFAASLRQDTDPGLLEHDAVKSLNALSDQFDSGEYDRLDANAFAAMDAVALAWARMGWKDFLQGDNVTAWQYLEAAWDLSGSGTVANRLAQVFEKTGARDRAEHMYALAAVAGGAEAQSSREKAMKLNPAAAAKELSQAPGELAKMRAVALPRLTSQVASARFALLFDNSNTPERVQFMDGDQSLRSAAETLQQTSFAVKFPDVSSIKIIRIGTASCVASGCSFELQPLNSMQQSAHPELATGPQKP